ncbi:MAG: TolC family protein [Betaproteobacteria bacterium]|nr:MAG: TolC family protein [Betaproteobacteria bacterium]
MKVRQLIAHARWCAPLLASVLLCACPAHLPYEPVDLDEKSPSAGFRDRAADDITLAELVSASGYKDEWPPERWRLDTLTLLGLYFNPDVDVARAQALASNAALATAAQRAPLAVELAAEHHSREVDGTPWSLGVAIGIPIGRQSRREARLERATFIADAAEIEIAASMWRVRGSVRDAVIDLTASSQRSRLLEQQVSIHRELTRLLERRVEAGMLSARELGRERTALATAQTQLALERSAYTGAYGDLASALGLPLQTVQSLTIAEDAFQQTTEVPDRDAARGTALLNRLDVHVRLLEFGAADAEVKLAVAEQYPRVRIRPGFFWDQGDSIWSLASVLIPPVTAQAKVREAEARREVAARRFTALQIHAISEVESAREVLLSTRSSVTAAKDIVDQAEQQFERMRRYFESGSGNRVELMTAQLNAVQARQHLLAAQIAWRKSAARYEDAVQVPVLGDFLKLPEQPAMAGAAL